MPAGIDPESLDVYVFLTLFAALIIVPIPLWFFAQWRIRHSQRLESSRSPREQ